MQEKQSQQKAGSQNAQEQSLHNDTLSESVTIELQDFFANLIPEPVTTSTNTTQAMDTDEVFSQLLASSISQGIDEFNHGFNAHPQINSSNQALHASSLIGRSVLVTGGNFYFENNNPVIGRLNISNRCHHVYVYVEDERGEIVRIIPLGDGLCGEISFTWNGKTRNNNSAEEGEYRFIVSALCNSRVIELPVLTYNKIIRAALGNGTDDIWLYFENDQTMNLNEVLEILKE